MAVFQKITNKWCTTVITGAVLGLFPNAMAMAQTSSDDLLPIPQNRPSVESYSLPPGPGSPSNENVLQGPVDADAPLARPTTAPPPATPARTPSPVPAPESDRPAAVPAPTSRASGQVQQQAGEATSQAENTEEPIVPETDSAPLNAEERQQPTNPSADSNLPSTQTVAEPVPETATNDWLMLSFAALLLVLLSALLLWRARRASPKQIESEEPDRSETLPIGHVAPLPKPLQPEPAIALGFKPHAANATLINAVLSFELTLSNHGSDVLTGIKVNGAMAQAEQKDSSNPVLADLSPLREVQDLQAGEAEKILSEFRIPLASIRPILFGSQALFVPLVRISIEFTDGSGFQHFQTASYLVGREHQPPRPKMAAFRLDLGPRSFAPLGYRALSAV